MRKTVALLTLAVGVSPLGGQSLEGVWKPVEIVVDSGPDRGRHTTDVQPGLLIITKRYYSMNFVQGFKARPVPSDSATAEQVALTFVPFTGNAGSYKRSDTTIIVSPSVAKHPAVMAGTPITVVYRLKRDTLWTNSGAPGATASKIKWVRVERR
ncbi:MAG TPA: hypothetical protein VEM14_05240 [Gemmatimonadaceae bacterium]|nr:hypothetical protein [Gemmatimonadaceae bacterium]